MGDSLDDLDLPAGGDVSGNSGALVTKPSPPKEGGWKAFFKFLGISVGAFVVVGNPYTALGLSKISFLNTPMKIFAVQSAIYFLVVAGAKWYLK
jgi:hypothetical protein